MYSTRAYALYVMSETSLSYKALARHVGQVAVALHAIADETEMVARLLREAKDSEGER